MRVLGIETSCDETAASVVEDGRRVLSNMVYSQTELHGPYGGVVPEIASRCHLEVLPGVIEEAVEAAGVGWGDVDAVAATYGPGLASSLIVGFSAAKGLAQRLGKPLVAVNHLQAHIYSAFMSENAPAFGASCPCAALVISGGHTSLVEVNAKGAYRTLGQTVDDAAGEAFDKGAKLLGLGYPGGPAIDRAAADGRRDAIAFPRGTVRWSGDEGGDLCAELCFSFSGLKTALLHYLEKHPADVEDEGAVGDVAASYQEAIVDAVVERCDRLMGRGGGRLAVGGGVSLNRRLRERLTALSDERGFRLLLAEPRFCGDNAAMIAGLAGYGQGITGSEAFALDIHPRMWT